MRKRLLKVAPVVAAITIVLSSSAGVVRAQPAPLAQLGAQLQQGIAERQLPSTPQPPISQWGSIATDYGASPHCWVAAESVTSLHPCRFGDPASAKLLVLTGDSQAWMWTPAVNRWAKAHGWALDVFTKGSCPPWRDPHQRYFDHSAYPQCAAFQAWVSAEILTLRPKVVLAAGLPPVWPTTFCQHCTTAQVASIYRSDVNRFAASVAPSGARLVFMAPSVDFYLHEAVSAPLCLSIHPSAIQGCDDQPLSSLVDHAWTAGYSPATIPPHSTWFPTTSLLCVNGTCPMLAGSKLIYSSDDHVTSEFAAFAAPAFGQLLAPAVAGL